MAVVASAFVVASSEEAPTASISDLPNDLLKLCFSFIPGQYITVAPVSRQFHRNYCTVGMDDSLTALPTDSLLKMGRNRRTTVDAVSNDIKLSEYAIINNAPREFMLKVCQSAAMNGRKDILDCAVSFGVNFSRVISSYNLLWKNENLIFKLPDEGNLEMLQYFDSEFSKDAWKTVYIRAKQNDHLHIMKWYLREKAHLIEERDFFTRDLIRSEIEVFEYVLEGVGEPRVTEELCQKAAEHGNIQVLEYCQRNHPQFEILGQHHGYGGLCHSSVINKDKEQAFVTLKWLRGAGCPWGMNFCSYAARFDNVEALKLARNKGCPWDQDTIRYAVERGNIPMIKYCLQNECPMTAAVCTSAMSIKDHNIALEVLKLLRKYTCPWNESTCAIAIYNGNFEAMLWAMRNGCPCRNDTFPLLVEKGNISVIEEVLQDEILYGSMIMQTAEKSRDGSSGCSSNRQ